MGASIQQDSSGTWVVRVTGALRKEEMDAMQAAVINRRDPGRIRLLVMVDPDFSGWVGSEEWNDMTFFVRHGDSISRIAIVGDPKWESRMLMFAAAGFRKAPVKFFPRERVPQAYSWLSQAAEEQPS